MGSNMTASEVRDMIRAQCALQGKKRWMFDHGIGKNTLNAVLRGSQKPTRAICRALKIRPVIVYEKENAE